MKKNYVTLGDSLKGNRLQNGWGKGDGDDAPEVLLAKKLKSFEDDLKAQKDEQSKLADLLKDNADAIKVKALEDSLKEINEKVAKQLPEIYDILVKQGTKITHLEGSQGGEKSIMTDTFSLQKREIKDALNSLKALADGQYFETKDANGKDFRSGEMILKELSLKSIVLRSAVSGNTQAQDVPGIGQLATRKMTMYDLFPKIQLGENNNGVIRYWDWVSASITRGADTVAENGTYPESVAAWAEYTLSVKKIGDSLPVSDEFFEDEAMFASELNSFLSTNVALKVDSQLYSGDNTGNNLKGIKTTVPTFTTSSYGIQAPNINDLMVKMKEAITSTGGGKYNVDFALMNIADINKRNLKKDRNDNYIIYPNGNADGSNIGGVTVFECNIVTANEMVIGDSRYAKIYEKKGISVEMGLVNDQFVKGAKTLRAQTRLNFLIRTVDQTGFLKSTDIENDVLGLA